MTFDSLVKGRAKTILARDWSKSSFGAVYVSGHTSEDVPTLITLVSRTVHFVLELDQATRVPGKREGEFFVKATYVIVRSN
jgi:hypothetical protein